MDLPLLVNNVPDYARVCEIETSIFLTHKNKKIMEPDVQLADESIKIDQIDTADQGGSGQLNWGGGSLYPGGTPSSGGSRGKRAVATEIVKKIGTRIMGKGVVPGGGRCGAGKSEPGIPKHLPKHSGPHFDIGINYDNKKGLPFHTAHDPAHRLRLNNRDYVKF